jgi:hypothetical protein
MTAFVLLGESIFKRRKPSHKCQHVCNLKNINVFKLNFIHKKFYAKVQDNKSQSL